MRQSLVRVKGGIGGQEDYNHPALSDAKEIIMPSTGISGRPARLRVACLRVARPRPGLLAVLAILMCLGVAPASRAGSGLDP